MFLFIISWYPLSFDLEPKKYNTYSKKYLPIGTKERPDTYFILVLNVTEHYKIQYILGDIKTAKTKVTNVSI